MVMAGVVSHGVSYPLPALWTGDGVILTVMRLVSRLRSISEKKKRYEVFNAGLARLHGGRLGLAATKG